MKYHVVLTDRARHDLREYFLHAYQDAPITAARWLGRFERALQGLDRNPRRDSLAPENDIVDKEIRQLLFGKGVSTFRALFTITQDEVYVLHIRRATRDFAAPGDLTG